VTHRPIQSILSVAALYHRTEHRGPWYNHLETLRSADAAERWMISNRNEVTDAEFVFVTS